MAPPASPARRLAVRLARVCAEQRCRDVVVLDLRRLSPVTQFFVIATGTSPRQMRTAAHYAAEGGEARWILIDYIDVVVHIFSDEARAYYDLDLLWGDAPRIDWQRGWKPREETSPDDEEASK